MSDMVNTQSLFLNTVAVNWHLLGERVTAAGRTEPIGMALSQAIPCRLTPNLGLYDTLLQVSIKADQLQEERASSRAMLRDDDQNKVEYLARNLHGWADLASVIGRRGIL